jgi:prolyl oligopeptidase
MGDDPYLWLEDITGERSLAWVREQNAATVRELATSADFETLRQRLWAIFDSKGRIPHVAKHGAYCYNFWRDTNHVRGVWRRTTLAE